MRALQIPWLPRPASYVYLWPKCIRIHDNCLWPRNTACPFATLRTCASCGQLIQYNFILSLWHCGEHAECIDGPQSQVFPMRTQISAMLHIAKCSLRCLPCCSFINFELSTEHTSKFGRDNCFNIHIVRRVPCVLHEMHLFAHKHFLRFVCCVCHWPGKKAYL